jgi:hypothetical protein
MDSSPNTEVNPIYTCLQSNHRNAAELQASRVLVVNSRLLLRRGSPLHGNVQSSHLAAEERYLELHGPEPTGRDGKGTSDGL